MYLDITILMLNLAYVLSYVAYEMFPGFDATKSPAGITSTTSLSTLKVNSSDPVSIPTTYRTTESSPVTITTFISTTTTTEEPSTAPILPITSSKFQCPEEEQPSNIGAYEVPTQRDIALLLQNSLMRRFNSYHGKALYFLKDIKEATKGTSATEKKCHGYGTDRALYKKCVRQVGNQCEVVTKGLVTSLERQRADVLSFTNGTVCNIKGLKTDPVELVKTLAMEEASLEFALPGFLRLLNVCSIYCNRMEHKQRPKKPLRHMTDQDLVVKHFLTQKNYIQLIKGSK